MTDVRKHKNAGKAPKHRSPTIGSISAPTPETMVIAGFTFAITKDRGFIPGFGPFFTATAKMTGENLPLPQAWCVWAGNGDTPEEALNFMKMKIEHEFE